MQQNLDRRYWYIEVDAVFILCYKQSILLCFIGMELLSQRDSLLTNNIKHQVKIVEDEMGNIYLPSHSSSNGRSHFYCFRRYVFCCVKLCYRYWNSRVVKSIFVSSSTYIYWNGIFRFVDSPQKKAAARDDYLRD